MKTKRSSHTLRVGLVVPHMFMHRDILPGVIFSPGRLAIDLANGLVAAGAEVSLFSPGPVDTTARNITADLSLFEQELALRGDSYTDLLRKHPVTFVTLARQVQAEIIAKAYEMANNDQLDIIHIYTNEEDIALPFARFCHKPVVFTHHDPFNFLIKHKNIFPKYKQLNWISISLAQRSGMPDGTNWVGNIYHGADPREFRPITKPSSDYAAYFGRIVEQKGVHLAIAATKAYNLTAKRPLKLKIAGKHYSSYAKDTYWNNQILPHIDGEIIEYVGHISDTQAKRDFLANAAVTIMPSLFHEPFGMVAIESMACGTPVAAIGSGAISEVVQNGRAGFVVSRSDDDQKTTEKLVGALHDCQKLDRTDIRRYFEEEFTLQKMVNSHLALYERLVRSAV